MNIAIFSGSFNPLHIGHLILGNYVTEFTDIHEVWYLITPQSPFKQDVALPDENIRLEMAKLALQNYPKLKATDFEFDLPRPSYTINTLEAIAEKYPEHNFSLLIGADNWTAFDKWKDYEKIIQQFKLYIYPRLGYNISIPTKYRSKVEALDSPIIEISSTLVRESISDNKNVKSFLPDGVYQYIVENKLYI